MCSLLPYSAGRRAESCLIHMQAQILIRGQPNAKAGTLTIAAVIASRRLRPLARLRGHMSTSVL
jgi:hypothetical protein